MSTQSYHFTLVLSGVDDNTEGLEDALFAAGCDDALINFREGTVYLDFDREAKNLEEAVISAIKDVMSSSLNARVASVAPDLFVTQVDIANRLNKSRQAVSLWIKRNRRNTIPFPNPIMKLDEKSPLWRWYDVAQWLYQQDEITDPEIVTNARFFEAINTAILEQDEKTKAVCHKLAKKLGAIHKGRAA